MSCLGDEKEIEDCERKVEYKNIQQSLTSIIILTYNKLDYNKLCIESIRQYTEPGSYEIIVIDNHSTDGTVEWLQCQEDISLILNSENIGFPAGCNQGIKAANGDSILLLNNDTIVTPNWLSNLKKCLCSSSNIGAVGAVTNSCSNFQSVVCEYSSIKEMIRFAQQFNNSSPELWENRARLVGFCMLMRTDVVNQIGLLDETFSPGNFEDDDYSLRIRNAGYRLVLCWDTFIHHFGSVSFGEQAVQFSNLLESNRRKFIEKWGLDPHCVVTSAYMQDVALKKWFIYQREYNYNKQLMTYSRYKFNSFIEQAEFALLVGNYERAALFVMWAANHAHHSHPGFCISPRLELIIRKIAKKLNGLAASANVNIPNKSINQRNVLHVLSQGYQSGGHTRLVERWISMDSKSTHSVLVTLNSATNPQWLADAALNSGGWYKTLDTTGLSLCQKAKTLRDVATMWADYVVFHIHPHDPIAPIAFGIPGGPPVVFLNHADHAFNVGVSVADLVADYRVSGKSITLARRNTTKAHVLPIPLKMPQRLQNKQTAKKALGISEDRIVFLTISTPYKLVPCGEYNFLNLLREIIKRHENVEMLVVGPSDCGEWAQLKNESNGRIKAFGIQYDLSLFHCAADIYLDSIPLVSPTSALEVGALGVPVIGLATDIAHFSNDIAPGIIKTHFPNVEELYSVIDKLVKDEDYRISQGDYLKTTILQSHCLMWTEHLKTLYSLLPANHQPTEISDVEEQAADSSDVIWAYVQHRSGMDRSSFL